MVERAGLENRCVRQGTAGSNPAPSAKKAAGNGGQFYTGFKNTTLNKLDSVYGRAC